MYVDTYIFINIICEVCILLLTCMFVVEGSHLALHRQLVCRSLGKTTSLTSDFPQLPVVPFKVREYGNIVLILIFTNRKMSMQWIMIKKTLFSHVLEFFFHRFVDSNSFDDATWLLNRLELVTCLSFHGPTSTWFPPIMPQFSHDCSHGQCTLASISESLYINHISPFFTSRAVPFSTCHPSALLLFSQ